MSVRPFTFLVGTFALAGVLVVGAVEYRADAAPVTKTVADSTQFAGHWVDQQNADIEMSVREDSGIYRVTGGDEAYGYNLSCLKKDLNAVCTGHGGRLEGQKFLYQSTFEFTANGSLVENWKAFNNLQTVSGKTTWKHP